MDAAVRADAAGQAGLFTRIWERIYLRQPHEVPPDALQHAQRALVDTLACIIGGARQPCTAAASMAAGDTAADRALVLGTASHALDYDDVCMLATCHPSAPVISALLCQLEQCDQPVRMDRLLTAHLVGTEIMLRLGAWLGFGHYELGFHATGTLGAIGATAAAAHLLQLPIVQAGTALAIAASSACGLRVNFGTDTKPLHVGFAASAALRAVALARAGATANAAGAMAEFARAYTGNEPLLPPRFSGDGRSWAMLDPGFEIKRYPSCYLTHRMIAGILKLRGEAGGHSHDPERMPRIDVEFPPGGTIPLQYPTPQTGLQGKFSAPYCAASAWIDARVGLSTFTDHAVQRAHVVQAMQHIHVHERTGAPEALDSAPVRVSIAGIGSVLVDWAPGSLQDPPGTAEFMEKWLDCERLSGVQAPGDSARQLLQADPAANARALLDPVLDAVWRCIRNRADAGLHA